MSTYSPPSLEKQEGMAVDALVAARQWLGPRSAEGGARAWAVRNLHSAAGTYICIAVRRFDSAGEVARYLKAHQVAELLSEMLDLWESERRQPFTAMDAGLAHASFLLGRIDLVTKLLDRTNEQVGQGAVSRLWHDYHRALGCLVDRGPYRRSLPAKLSGSQRLWARQLEVIEALTSGREPDTAATAAREEFERENRDRRLIDVVVTTIFPSGLDPVGFDLALWGILHAADGTSGP